MNILRYCFYNFRSSLQSRISCGILHLILFILFKEAKRKGEQENLKIIHRSGQHLLNLINAVLDMAKIETGQVELKPTSFDLDALVHDIIGMMRYRAEAKELRLLLQQSSQVPRYVQTDAEKLRQILINLLNNAVRYTSQGGVTLRVDAEPDKEAGKVTLFFEVEDSGTGISPKNCQHIFQPFVQTGEFGGRAGAGLGLTVTKEYVELMGGEIQVSSQMNIGSVFKFDVSFTPTETAEATEASASDSATSEEEEE